MGFERILIGTVSVVALFGLTACGGGKKDAPKSEASAATANGVQCVELAPGAYYWDGQGFSVSPTPNTGSVPAPRPTGAAPASGVSQLERAFPDLGFPWMGLRVRNKVAVLTGLAPDLSAKERGLAAGESAIQSQAANGTDITLIVDGIAVEGGDHGVGESLASLTDSNLSMQACQTAFNDTMRGRNVHFQTNLAIISPTSSRLLDAVTGVAMLCDAYDVEIGGHTDSRGSNEYNEILSQQRADAVRDYLIEKGVNPDSISAKGYGESRPLDSAETYEAWAKNRRTEFKVSMRR